MLTIQLDGLPGQSQSGIVNIARPQTLFTPGQRLSGKVVLNLEKEDNIPQVFVKFQGKVRTSIVTGAGNNRRRRRYHYIMFHFEKLLFSGGEFKMRATLYEWPFSFTFPTEFNMTLSPFDSGEGNGYTVGRQPLPPSCMDVDDGRTTGAVVYSVRARIPRTFLDWKFKTQLNFTPVRLEAYPHSMHMPKKEEDMQHVQKYRYDEAGPRSLTTKESFSDKFHSKTDTKIINFRVTISAPTVVVIGKPYPLIVTLQSPVGEKEVVPVFEIDSVRAHFKSYTQVRVEGVFGDRESDVENEIPLANLFGGMGIKLPIGQPVELTGVFPNRIYAPPTFSTCAMFRRYRLTVHLTVRCLDEAYKISCRWSNVLLLPHVMEDGVEEAIEMMRNTNLTISDDPPSADDGEGAVNAPAFGADVPPPTYQEGKSGI